MKNYAFFLLLFIVLLFTSCTVAIQKDRGLRDNGINITAYENGREIEILDIEQGSTIFGEVLRISMPFFRINAGTNEWTGERYVEMDVFR